MNKIQQQVKYISLFIVIVFFAAACKKSDPIIKPDPDPVKKPTIAEVTTNVNTALASKDTLSQFATMFKTAGLTQAEIEGGITVFAPSNKAYTLKTDGIKKVTATDVYLPDSSVVRDYIVPGKIDMTKTTSGTSLTALSGKSLVLTKVGEKWLLNGVFLNITVLSTGDNAVVFSLAGLFNTSSLPHITGVSDEKTFPGWPLTIYGGNLGITADKNVVKIDGITATIHSAGADSLVVTVPQGVQAGALTVTTKGRTISGPANLTIQHAVVTTSAAKVNSPIQGLTLDASDNIYWTNNAQVDAFTSNSLAKYSGGQTVLYSPLMPNPNQDGTNIQAFKNNSLWAVALNSQNQAYVATLASKGGYGGIFRVNAATPNVAEWWAGAGANYNATTKADLKVYTTAITFDKQDNLYLFNGGNVQKINPNGGVSTAISGQEFLNADGTVKTIASSYGVIVTGSKTYLSDNTNGRIWLKDATGLKVIAGNNTHVAKDGTGTAAQFGSPFGIVLDKKGNLYVCDNDYSTSKFLIRMINPYGEVTTIAGGAGAGSDIDGTGTAAGFNGVNAIAVDSKGVLYIGTDAGNIRKITFQ